MKYNSQIGFNTVRIYAQNLFYVFYAVHQKMV